MHVRDHQETDLESVVAVFTRAVHDLTGAHYDAAQRAAWAPLEPDLQGWRDRLGALQVRVAEADGSIAGFIGHGPPGHVDLLYVDPRYARRRVATMLLHDVAQIANEAGAQRLFTEASLVARPVL